MGLSLADVFDGIMDSDWDVATGTVSDFVKIAPGTYEGQVTKVTHSVTKKGGDAVHITIEDFDDNNERIYPRASIYFPAEINSKNKSYAARQLKTIMKIAHIADVELTDDMAEDLKGFVEGDLQALLGTDLVIEIQDDEFGNGEIQFEE